MDDLETVDHMDIERDQGADDAAQEAAATSTALETLEGPATETSRPGGRHPLRAVLLAVLVACLVIAGMGSVVLTSQASRPSVPAALLTPGVVLAHADSPAYPTAAPQRTVTLLVNPGTSHSHTLVLPTPTPATAAQPPASGGTQRIVVSLSQQRLWAYQDGQVVFTTLVTTGMPALATPMGTFSIYYKVANTEFISPWPPGSPYYYSPEHVNYAMEFLSGGYFIHDAPWRSQFGPGTEANGSHGCVEVPTPAGAWLYSWTRYGTTVQIVS